MTQDERNEKEKRLESINRILELDTTAMQCAENLKQWAADLAVEFNRGILLLYSEDFEQKIKTKLDRITSDFKDGKEAYEDFRNAAKKDPSVTGPEEYKEKLLKYKKSLCDELWKDPAHLQKFSMQVEVSAKNIDTNPLKNNETRLNVNDTISLKGERNEFQPDDMRPGQQEHI